MRKLTFIILLLFIISMFVNCAKNDTQSTNSKTETTPKSKKNIILGFAQIGAESDWRKANSESIKSAAIDAGIQLMFTDAQQKQENQIKAIRSFVAQQVDVIAFSPVIESGWDNVLNEAKIASIPVIITDRSIETNDETLYVTVMGSDFVEEGRRAGNWLIQKFKNQKGDINIVQLEGTIGSAPAIDRGKGFEEVIKSQPNMKIITSVSADFMRSKGKEEMEKILKSTQSEGKRIDVLYAQNDDMALGAIAAMEESGVRPGSDITIISCDAIKEAFNAMIAGKLNCSVECNALLGPPLMKVVKDLAEGIVPPKRIITEESVFPAEIAAKELPLRKY